MSMDNMLRIAIVDDMEQDRRRITEETAAVLNEGRISHSIDCYHDAEALLDAVRVGIRYNLLLLDVQMDEMDGMALARELRSLGDQSAIVFISHSQEMARLGYRVGAARYLLKPLDRLELKEALLHLHGQWQDKKEILLPTGSGQRRTSLVNIQFAEAYDRGTRFFLTDETVETRLKFGEVERLLPRSMFLTCHRAYIVNLAFARGISQYEFRMKSGAVVPISRYRYSEVNQAFVDFLTD